MHDLFVQNLKLMDFDPTDKEFRSVVLVSDKHDIGLDFSQVLALEEAEKFKATAVYFRHFPDGRSPIPQIYIYDNLQIQFSETDLASVHRDLWSHCRIPMFITVNQTDVQIFDTRKPVDIVNNEIKTTPIDTVEFASDAIKSYTKILFDKGIFWESPKAKGHFLASTSAYSNLITNLKHIRQEFLRQSNVDKKIAHKLLVFAILIKYLEERGNENEGLFAKNFFRNFGAENLCGVLRQKGKILDLFDTLSRKFNGKIFEWDNDEERNVVQTTDLNSLADFLDADFMMTPRQGNLFGWKLYSFNHLAVELISSVYEEFLNENSDAVYTPEFLVNTLVDEALSRSNKEGTLVKTLDVSCGSGIFLVSIFKRLVQRYRQVKLRETRKLARLESDELLQIIRDNIFGIDIEEDAIRLTTFSICVALCDELDPPEIWEKLKFDDTFENNFKVENFFEYVEKEENLGKFDLVIGNAPFISLSLKKDENGKVFGQ